MNKKSLNTFGTIAEKYLTDNMIKKIVSYLGIVG